METSLRKDHRARYQQGKAHCHEDEQPKSEALCLVSSSIHDDLCYLRSCFSPVLPRPSCARLTTIKGISFTTRRDPGIPSTTGRQTIRMNCGIAVRGASELADKIKVAVPVLGTNLSF